MIVDVDFSLLVVQLICGEPTRETMLQTPHPIPPETHSTVLLNPTTYTEIGEVQKWHRDGNSYVRHAFPQQVANSATAMRESSSN